MRKLIWLAMALAGPVWGVDYHGVNFTIEPAWSLATPPRTIQPVRYRLDNRALAQEIEVTLAQPEGARLTRSHHLEAGESVTGWFYLPLRAGHWSYYATGSFRAEKSGPLPRTDWVGVSFPQNYHLQQANMPRLLLVGQRFDLTGLQDAVESMAPGHTGGRGSVQGAFARVGAESVPPSWVGLAGIGAVFLEQGAAEALSSESKAALTDYVSAGGVLALVSTDPGWCVRWWGNRGMPLEDQPQLEINYGLGAVKQLLESPTGSPEWRQWLTRLRTWRSQAGNDATMIASRPGGEFIAGLGALEELGGKNLTRPDFPRVSYMSLWWLMTVFAIIVGPVNYGFLRKRGRLPWFIITAPAISLVFGGALLATFLVAEGRQAKAVVGGVTYLFQRDHQALAIQRMSAYTTKSLPLTYPVGTLVWDKFGREFGDNSNHYHREKVTDSPGTIDFTSGWQWSEQFLPPRLLRAFGTLQPRTERGRLLFESHDGQWMVQNGLGVELTGLIYRSADRRLWATGPVRNGATASLQPHTRSLPDWYGTVLPESELPNNRNNLTPNAYIAVTSETFGFEKPHRRLTVKPTPHIIYGFL